MSTFQNLRNLVAKWSAVPAAERANYQLYLVELAEALDLGRPQPRGSGYEFEFPIRIVNPDGSTTTRFADLVKEGCFVLEAKDEEAGKSTDLLLRRAFGQAAQYAAFTSGGPPPYLIVLDVGATLTVWDRWGGTYGGFQAGHRIDLTTLANNPADVALLRDIWTNPRARDPRATSNAVTREIAEHLAKLASALESRGLEQERVARFLMRCVFTMFAEDVGLLPDEPFRGAVSLGLQDPGEFGDAVRELWEAMDEGKRFGLKKLLRFNGRFFAEAEVIPLERGDLTVLLEAAKADWRHVEPTIFGTLLTRALNPKERHRLGAEYTPREFIERIVRPTIEEPIRERWALVQAEVLQLRESGKKKDINTALLRLREFHRWMRSLQVLDPACGSGNFLYVALAVMKGVELEVIRDIEAITKHPELAMEEIDPSQFHGIEVKAWAREIAELTLWIGYHQWWRRTHGHTQPPEPVLRDTGTLEHRDAILNRSSELAAPSKACLAPWPRADFIVGNPPFLGEKRQRETLGDAYVKALRAAYPELPDSADLVMYWWYRAAMEVAEGRAMRAGLITTQSLTQKTNRQIVESAAASGVRVTWAIADHYWNDGSDDARVRVAMTVLAKEPSAATLVVVDGDAQVVREVRVPRLNADLSAHADVPRAASEPLTANQGLCFNGFNVVGRGFVLEADEARELRDMVPEQAERIRPYRNGRDLAARPRGVSIIDFALLEEQEARKTPVLFDLVRDRVKPQRDTNARESYRKYWWRFGEARSSLREALEGLPRFIATPYVAAQRFFVFLPAEVAPDDALRVIASDDAFLLGVLSSQIHVIWALAAGSRFGIDGTPRYNQTLCFNPFPFPAVSLGLRREISEIAERIQEHREAALQRSEKVTVTVMYNVVDRLRGGTALSAAEREVHRLAACGILRDLHDELDQRIARAYGWAWPMEREQVLDRLVALHEVRKVEEKQGEVRWLRPDFQLQRFGSDLPEAEFRMAAEKTAEQDMGRVPWPAEVLGQLAVLRDSIAAAPGSAPELARRFRGARRTAIEAHLEALTILGVIQRGPDGQFHAVVPPLVASAA